jgi:uncharacterized protein (DUF1778 family)
VVRCAAEIEGRSLSDFLVVAARSSALAERVSVTGRTDPRDSRAVVQSASLSTVGVGF